MVWVLPATAAGAVRTVAGAAVALAAGEPLAEAAVMPPPTTSTARPIPAMMIFGCRMVISSEVDCLLTTNTDSRDSRVTRQAGYFGGGGCGGGGAGARARMPRPLPWAGRAAPPGPPSPLAACRRAGRTAT